MAGRPKGSKNKPKEGAATPGPSAAQQTKRQQSQAQAQPQAQRPAAASPAAAPAAPAAAPLPAPQDDAPHQPTGELEKQRLKLANELAAVEARIYHLETQYLENSSPFGNAIRGYEGFLGGAAIANRKVVVKPEDRLFSWSSVTGQMPGQQR